MFIIVHQKYSGDPVRVGITHIATYGTVQYAPYDPYTRVVLAGVAPYTALGRVGVSPVIEVSESPEDLDKLIAAVTGQRLPRLRHFTAMRAAEEVLGEHAQG